MYLHMVRGTLQHSVASAGRLLCLLLLDAVPHNRKLSFSSTWNHFFNLQSSMCTDCIDHRDTASKASMWVIKHQIAVQVDLATSGRGSVGAFIGVCLIIAGLGIADGTAQGALVGDLSFMNPVYIQVHFSLPCWVTKFAIADSGLCTTDSL